MTGDERVQQAVVKLLIQAGLDEADCRDPEFNFVRSGELDSFQVVGFLAELEEELGVSFTTEELVQDEAQTVGGLMSIARRKLASG